MFTVILTVLRQGIVQGIPILLGSTGEIITEKSGNLNLGIPGLMYMGGISGLMSAFMYERAITAAGGTPVPIVGFLISFFFALLVAAAGAFVFSFLTISLRANQNVVGLALTTFGIGFGNFFGGSISKLAGGVGQISVATTASAYQKTIPFLSEIPFFGTIFFSYGFLTYFAIILAFAVAFFLLKTRAGLNLRSIGENPAAADSAGINIEKYKYIGTVFGGAIAGLGGLYFVMEYLGGTWNNNGFGDRGWLAVALVIFALWDSRKAILGAMLFGFLYVLPQNIPGISRSAKELFKMSQYLITIIVLVFASIRNQKENQAPEKLGVPFFREDR